MNRPTRLRQLARPVRYAATVGYLVVFVLAYRRWGFPFDRETIMLWIGAAFAVVSIGRDRHWVKGFVRDWIPFAIMLALYDLGYGLVEYIGLPVVVTPQVAIDKAMFGGQVSAVWLQQHIAHTGPVGWWEVGVAIVYASHFVVPFATAGVLWWRSRNRWRQWTTQLLTVSFTAVIVYAIVPTGAPWYAAKKGLISTLDRPVGRGWLKIGLRAAPQLLERGRLFSNQYAAVPSLHAGYSFLFALFVYRAIGRGRWRLIAFLYPLAMAFVLMYGGEHFAIDILAAWALAAGAAPLWAWMRRRTVAIRSRRSRVLTTRETFTESDGLDTSSGLAKVRRQSANTGESV
jgi:hypothetical protein